MKGRLHELARAMIAAIGQARLEPKVPVPVFRGATPKRHRPTKTSYGRGLMNQWGRQARDRQAKLGGLRDEHGAYTVTGRNTPIFGSNAWDSDRVMNWQPGRRVWLAGVSAQRGY